MKASEIQAYLRSLDGGWMNLERTVDTFKAGDPATDVTGIAVGWMSYTWALERAVELGCNLFITHEPTYYNHFDNHPRMFEVPHVTRADDTFRFQSVRDKRQFIEDNKLVVLRCHDLWDQMPDIGIPDSWAELLSLGPVLDCNGYYRVLDVSGRTAEGVARQVAARTKRFGQEAVQLLGSPDKPVTRACIGTGAITSYFKFIDEYRADIAICSDDGMTYWRDGAFAIDMGIPIVCVNHPVTEEPGLINLAKHLRSKFPDVPVHHVSQRCMVQLVTNRPGGDNETQDVTIPDRNR